MPIASLDSWTKTPGFSDWRFSHMPKNLFGNIPLLKAAPQPPIIRHESRFLPPPRPPSRGLRHTGGSSGVRREASDSEMGIRCPHSSDGPRSLHSRYPLPLPAGAAQTEEKI